ncbi:MAG TPA: ATP-binding protein [Actinomycetota bacterium]
MAPKLVALLAWVPVVCLADLMPVVLWDSVELTMSLPVLLAAGMIFSPFMAALLAFVATTDRREFKREISLMRGLFNRSNVAISVLAASYTFHELGGDTDVWPTVLVFAFVALICDMAINNTLAIVGSHLLTGESLLGLVREVYGRGRPAPFLIGYGCFGLLAVVLATVHSSAGNWGLVAFVIPLFLARQMFMRDRQFSRATEALDEKTHVIRDVSSKIADERRDERLSVAAGLHDEVLPPLYKVHLMGQVIRQDLATGRLLDLEGDIPSLLQAAASANEAIRVLISNLRRSPLGPSGLAGTIRLLARHLEQELHPRFDLSLEEVGGTPLTQLLVYQVAREAMTNAARYAEARRICVSLQVDQGVIRLVVEDDGRGFLPASVDREAHFGIELMRERVELIGGVFRIESLPGYGTSVVARFPLEVG